MDECCAAIDSFLKVLKSDSLHNFLASKGLRAAIVRNVNSMSKVLELPVGFYICLLLKWEEGDYGNIEKAKYHFISFTLTEDNGARTLRTVVDELQTIAVPAEFMRAFGGFAKRVKPEYAFMIFSELLQGRRRSFSELLQDDDDHRGRMVCDLRYTFEISEMER